MYKHVFSWVFINLVLINPPIVELAWPITYRFPCVFLILVIINPTIVELTWP